MKKKKIVIFTGSRADYGILQNLIVKFKKEKKVITSTLVGSHHFSHFYGNTYKEIINDKIKIDYFIKFSTNNILKQDLINYLSKSILLYKKILTKLNPNIILILGDRYEAFSLALCSFYLGIPIGHIHGGEVTSGSLDDAHRHMISKLSAIHFPSHEVYKNRLIQLGENRKNIFLSGSLGVENIINLKFRDKNELYENLKLDIQKETLLITFHSETISNIMHKDQIRIFLRSLTELKNLNLVFTFSNSDPFSFLFIKYINKFKSKSSSKVYIFKSLGKEIYLNLMKYSKIIVGNSSSGIIEAPAFNVTTLNVGERQSGRYRYKSIIDCELNSKKIYIKIKKILKQKKNFQNKIIKKNSANIIIKKITEKIMKDDFQPKKFYDIKF